MTHKPSLRIRGPTSLRGCEAAVGGSSSLALFGFIAEQ